MSLCLARSSSVLGTNFTIQPVAGGMATSAATDDTIASLLDPSAGFATPHRRLENNPAAMFAMQANPAKSSGDPAMRLVACLGDGTTVKGLVGVFIDVRRSYEDYLQCKAGAPVRKKMPSEEKAFRLRISNDARFCACELLDQFQKRANAKNIDDPTALEILKLAILSMRISTDTYDVDAKALNFQVDDLAKLDYIFSEAADIAKLKIICGGDNGGALVELERAYLDAMNSREVIFNKLKEAGALKPDKQLTNRYQDHLGKFGDLFMGRGDYTEALDKYAKALGVEFERAELRPDRAMRIATKLQQTYSAALAHHDRGKDGTRAAWKERWKPAYESAAKALYVVGPYVRDAANDMETAVILNRNHYGSLDLDNLDSAVAVIDRMYNYSVDHNLADLSDNVTVARMIKRLSRAIALTLAYDRYVPMMSEVF